MTQEVGVLRLSALFVDDDEEIVQQCEELLPKNIGGHEIEWSFVRSFEEAEELLQKTKFDVVVTDVYKGRKLTGRSGVSPADNHATKLVELVKGAGFSLVILYSDGPRPDEMIVGNSIKFIDKSAADPPFPSPVEQMLATLLEGRGRSLDVIRSIQSELERTIGSYIWGFIDEHWDALREDAAFEESGLERLIRRRVAIQVNERFESQSVARRPHADRYDYYVYPPLPGPLRLGTLVRRVTDQQLYIVLTPHCHLAQNGKDKDGKLNPPRADFVLLAQCLPAQNILGAVKETKKQAGCLRIPAIVGSPEGRYCFLPKFASLPDVLCDLMQLSSVPHTNLVSKEYEKVAVVDSPFAEAIQSSFNRFYANVGHRNLIDTDFSMLFDEGAVKKAALEPAGAR